MSIDIAPVGHVQPPVSMERTGTGIIGEGRMKSTVYSMLKAGDIDGAATFILQQESDVQRVLMATLNNLAPYHTDILGRVGLES